MKKKAKAKYKHINITKTLFFVLVIIIVFILIILIKFRIKNFVDIKKQSNSTATQKSFIITNESGSIKKEIPIKPASVGNIKFEKSQRYTPRSTPTILIKNKFEPQNNIFDYLFNRIETKDQIYKIDIDAAKFLYDSGRAIFIDARNHVEFKESHIKGAVSIQTNATPEEINKLKNMLKDKVLITYCHGIGCHLSDRVAYKLYDMGYRNIAIFFGGWNEWNKYNYPIEK